MAEAGGPGKAEDSNWKERTGAQRTGQREMGVVRGIFYLKPAKWIYSGRATFLNYNSGYAGSGESHTGLEKKEVFFHTGEQGAGEHLLTLSTEFSRGN